MWARIKAFCLNSLTIAWSYLLAVVGAVLQAIEPIMDMVGSQDFKSQLSAAIGDAQLVGRIILAISIVNIFVRMLSLRKAGQ